MSSFRALGRRFVRATVHDRCPICGRTNPCAFSDDRELALCKRTPNEGPQVLGCYLHELEPGAWQRRPAQVEDEPTHPPQELAEPERLHEVLRALLVHPALSLVDRHRVALLRRGLDTDRIRRNGYATMPDNRPRKAAVDSVRARFNTSGVPGLYFDRRGRGAGAWTVSAAPGLLVPARDQAGRIRGAQVRPDKLPEGDKRKYRWISSGGKEGGAGSGTPLHWTLEGDRDGPLWVTEGPLKADVAAALSGYRFLGFAGCHAGQHRRLLQELRECEWPPAQPIVLAIDSDFRTNPAVRQVLVSMARTLTRSGYNVSVATWAPELGKGIDDCLHGGATIGEGIRLAPPEEYTGDLPAIRPSARPEPWTPPPSVTLEEAQQRLRDLCDRLTREPVRGCYVVAATFGAGKTRAACASIVDAYRFGTHATFRPPQGGTRRLRTCVLTDTREQAETICQTLTELGLPDGEAALLFGREGLCDRPAEVKALGAHRHSPSAELCHSCPIGEAGKCRYLAQRKTATEADIVVTCKPALLSEASDLRRFDLVICDEDLLPTLIDEWALTRAHMNLWVAGMDADGEAEDSSCRVFVRLLQRTCSAQVNPPARPRPKRSRRERLLPALRLEAEAQGLELADLLGAVLCEVREKQNAKSGRMTWEDPWDWDPEEREKRLRSEVPLRAFADLAAMVSEELEEARADTRLWLDVDGRGVKPGAPVPPDAVTIHAFRPQERVLAGLRDAAVIVLDATPDLERLRVIFGPANVTVTELRVPELLHVTQLRDKLRHPNPRERAAIVAQAEAEAGEPPVILTRKHLAESGAGWFGRHNRATNEFEGRGAVVLEDHYLLPPDAARAFVECWRFSSPPSGTPPRYVPYEGTELEARVHGNPPETDTDVFAYLRHAWGAEVTQAIGRLRACRQERAVRVYVTSNDPVPGLRVDRLLTTAEFLGTSSATSAERLAALRELNSSRQRETARRIAEALAQYLAENGELPSIDALRGLAGCGRSQAVRALRAANGRGSQRTLYKPSDAQTVGAHGLAENDPLNRGGVPTDGKYICTLRSVETPAYFDPQNAQTHGAQAIAPAKVCTASVETPGIPGPEARSSVGNAPCFDPQNAQTHGAQAIDAARGCTRQALAEVIRRPNGLAPPLVRVRVSSPRPQAERLRATAGARYGPAPPLARVPRLCLGGGYL